MHAQRAFVCGGELSALHVQVKLGPSGIEEFLPLGTITPYERAALTEAISILQGNITKGIEFANQA